MAVVCYDITCKYLYFWCFRKDNYDPNSPYSLSTARLSFENVNKWISEARNYRGEDIMIVLVGNKLDDEENR